MSNVADVWLGKDYGKIDEENQERRVWRPLRQKTGALYRSAKADKLRGLAASKKGYAEAGRSVDRSEASTVGRLVADTRSGAAEDKASAQARGLDSSGVDRAAASDMARAREEVDAGISALRGRLSLGAGQSEVSGLNDMAGFEMQSMQQQSQMEFDRIQALNSIRYGRQGGLLKPVLTAVGAIVGAYFGAPTIGAGLGAAAGGAAQGEY